MKILALDVGDKWTGTSISDPLAMFARPYKTVQTINLEEFLSEVIKAENIQRVIVGYPKTLRGTESEQTRKIKSVKSSLEKRFETVDWVFWDERLSSKRAGVLKKAKTKEDKIFSHSIAAAFILDSYLVYLQTQKNM